MAELKTVEIVNPDNPDEFIVVNQSDYEADQGEDGEKSMTLWEERDQGGAEGDPEVNSEVAALLEGSVADLEARLTETTDVELLKAAKAVEEADKNRSTAIDAIEERIGELES